ncbi:hypothetical protein Vau01_008560 [Virgisporangium aurantiacum]|uniref:Mucoidy inhibitor MuiA family protein n=1 Tax=Virgisporangium aurantiacum TaxID=175570 RepID=A0A8J3Z106_9ACTN|nr:hypothetical protein Vau01_008560 [Virgisporangium aurantiacum]
MVDAPIVSVTVYPDQARITRRGSVDLEPGRQKVFIEPLPLQISADSVRVGGQGHATVLGVDVVRRSHSRPTDPAVADLTERRRALAADIAELADADAVHQEQLAFLSALGTRASVSFARALAGGETDAARVAETAAALADRSIALRAERRGIARRREEIADELSALERRISAPAHPALPDRMAAAVDVEVAEAGTVHLELSYLVGGAGWTSVYDVRVDGQQLALTWFGLVTQRTGEDWPEGELLLSTARPSGTASVPELKPWYLDRYQPAPPPMPYPVAAAPMAPGGAPPASGAAPRARSVAAPPPPVQEAVATVEHGVSASTYRTTRPVAVPADGTAHRATVAVVDLDAALDYVTAPVRAAEAHLRATVVNRSPHTLLPGPASVFSGGVFVGKAALEMWAPGEEIELALGVDDRIRVERTLVGRRATKATLGSSRRREVEYRVLVTNHTPAPARVTVLDQLPVSRDENIAVRELHLHPAPSDRTEMGVLTWRFEVPPGGAAEVLLGLRIDLTRGVEMVGWRE